VLASGGLDAERAILAGQLLVLDFDAVYGPPHDLQLDAVLAGYRREAQRSRADGYAGLRVAVEMGDFAKALGSLEALARWEHIVGKTFAETGITALCDYDGRLFDAAARECIAAEHAAVAVDDGTMPHATFTATGTPRGVVVAGELDLTNAAALARSLHARAAVSPVVDVDLGDVTFIDLTAARAVFEVAAELPSESVIILRRAPLSLRRILRLVGWRDPRVRVDRA